MADNNIIVRGLDNLLTWLLKFEGMEAEKFHVEAAAYIKAMILARTSKGQDYTERRFTPYSAPWKKVRKARGLPVRSVDLFFSGQMLSSITWKANKDRAVVFFRPSSDERGITNSEKAYFNQEGRVPRKFFAMSKSDIEHLSKIYWDILKAKVGL